MRTACQWQIPNEGSQIYYESQKLNRTVHSTTVSELYSVMKCFGTSQFLRGLWMGIRGDVAQLDIRTDAHNLVTTAATATHFSEQEETMHIIQMLRKESCSGAIEDLAHVCTNVCMADCLTKNSAKPDVV